MRLWHKDLIYILPRQQLLGQWRECCLIAKNIAEKGTPNHILVNRIMDYPIEHFYCYSNEVMSEMRRRGYKVDRSRFLKWVPADVDMALIWHDSLFPLWHNERYMHQCLMNLQEKYDCGGISEEEYRVLVDNTVIYDL